MSCRIPYLSRNNEAACLTFTNASCSDNASSGVTCLVYILTIPIRRKSPFNEGNNVLVEHALKLCSIS